MTSSAPMIDTGADGTSDASGHVTLTFPSVPSQQNWSGQVSVPNAPANSQWQILVNGKLITSVYGTNGYTLNLSGGSVLQIIGTTAPNTSVHGTMHGTYLSGSTPRQLIIPQAVTNVISAQYPGAVSLGSQNLAAMVQGQAASVTFPETTTPIQAVLLSLNNGVTVNSDPPILDVVLNAFGGIGIAPIHDKIYGLQGGSNAKVNGRGWVILPFENYDANGNVVQPQATFTALNPNGIGAATVYAWGLPTFPGFLTPRRSDGRWKPSGDFLASGLSTVAGNVTLIASLATLRFLLKSIGGMTQQAAATGSVDVTATVSGINVPIFTLSAGTAGGQASYFSWGDDGLLLDRGTPLVATTTGTMVSRINVVFDAAV